MVQLKTLLTVRSQSASIPSSGRIGVLDSIRGIAAVVVVLHHSMLLFERFWNVYGGAERKADLLTSVLAYSPAHLLWAGPEAVLVFFVLSGLVLSMPFVSSETPGTWDFLRKRLCRIFIPYAAATVVSVLVYWQLGSIEVLGLSDWYYSFWNRPLTLLTGVDQILMLGQPSQNVVNPVTWSLVHELRISLVFPLLMLVVRYVRPTLVLVGAVLLSLTTRTVAPAINEYEILRSLCDTVAYLWLFVAGAEIAMFWDSIQQWYRRLSAPLRWALWMASLCLLNSRWTLPQGLDSRIALAAAHTLAQAGAVILLVAATGISQFDCWLDSRIGRWLGEVSYSLYLLHVPLAFALIRIFGDRLPLLALAFSVLPLSLGLAWLFNRSVERWSVSLGRRRRSHMRSFSVAIPREPAIIAE